jgi:hypothetical protein
MDGLVLMGESLCRADPGVSLHLTVPNPPASVRAWAESRPQVHLSTDRPHGVRGWDVKPWLLLQELNAGAPEALWLDDDIVVTRSILALLREFPSQALIVAEEWTPTEPAPVSHYWGMEPGRSIPMINACVVRASQAHRPLLERYLKMACDNEYRAAQALPFERRPLHLLHDGWLLIALLQSREFSRVDFACLRRDRDIAQCAGSSNYRPGDRVLDLFRGLPALIHGLGRKPWTPAPKSSSIEKFLLDFATDVSPYVLAARKVARDLGMAPEWIETRTWMGSLSRALTGGHPGAAGLMLSITHAMHMRLGGWIGHLSGPRVSVQSDRIAVTDGLKER